MFSILKIALRVLVGLLIIKTGVDLASGHHIFIGFSTLGPFLSGLFVILIGAHIIFSSIFSALIH